MLNNALVAILAFLIDKVFGEFKIKHPVVYFGDYIKFFEKYFYKDSVLRGFYLLISLIFLTFCITKAISYTLAFLPTYIEIILLSIIASTAIAHNMLFSCVQDVLISKDPKKALSYLVSRDTNNMNESQVYQGAIETYAENLSDGVIAPLLFLYLFGIEGVFIYKTVNTLDSMVGYKNLKYSNYGKCSARADDILNFLPSRITAFFVFLITLKKEVLISIFKTAHLSQSPNAGYPISAVAGSTNIALGGEVSYEGKIINKSYLGYGKNNISKQDLINVLDLREKIDLIIIIVLICGIFV